jgi:hypothetical protein
LQFLQRPGPPDGRNCKPLGCTPEAGPYRDVAIDSAYRIDILIGDVIVVEVKCVARLLPVHSAQVLTYMKLVKAKHGLLFNFNAVRLTESMRSLILDPSEGSASD